MTNAFEEWKQKVLALQEQVDAFLVLSNVINDARGAYVPDEDVMRWYLAHVRIPDVARSRRLVTLGLLCAADGSGQTQGFEAVRIAHDLLANGNSPATYPAFTPMRGPLLVNRQRARMLGIDIPEGVAEEIVERASAWQGSGEAKP